jgi:exonuclease V
MVGVIDEIRLPVNEKTINPILVDTKTRTKPTLPAEPQKRNARFAV